MKITKHELQNLIIEEIRTSRSVLLEMPDHPIVGQEQEGDHTKDPNDYEDDKVKRSLYHMSQQSQQLHDMMMDDDQFEPDVHEKIRTAARYLEEVFKAITYEKQHPEGR